MLDEDPIRIRHFMGRAFLGCLWLVVFLPVGYDRLLQGSEWYPYL